MSKKNNDDYKIIRIEDEEYPEKLRNIKEPPKELYVRGNLPDPKKKAVAIVGARNSSDYGSTLAKTLGKVLSINGVEIISGLALGIDTMGHIGALEVNNKTYAVLGCGVDICYPAYNRNVYDKIIECGGGIISELSNGTLPLPFNFPRRNRIISALSDVIIVVEARENSGSLITSDYALEQGKTIFACPGRVGDLLSKGTNNLIKEGAYILTSVDDVLEHLGLVVDGMIPKKEIDLSTLDYYEKMIYDLLENDILHIDEIVEKTKMPIEKCINVLMSLELNGLVEMTICNYYKRSS